EGGAQSDRQVIGELPATQWQHLGVPNAAVNKDGDVGRAATDIGHDHARLLLVVAQYGFTRGERLEHQVVHLHAGRLDAVEQVVYRRHGSRDDVRFDFEAEALHADRVAHAVNAVEREAARDHV